MARLQPRRCRASRDGETGCEKGRWADVSARRRVCHRACQQRRPFLAGEASRGVPGRGAYPERVRGLLEFPVVPFALATVWVGHVVRPAAEARAHGRGRVPARLASSPVFITRASFDAVPKLWSGRADRRGRRQRFVARGRVVARPPRAMGGFNLGDTSVTTSLKYGLNASAKRKPAKAPARPLAAFADADDDDDGPSDAAGAHRRGNAEVARQQAAARDDARARGARSSARRTRSASIASRDTWRRSWRVATSANAKTPC